MHIAAPVEVELDDTPTADVGRCNDNIADVTTAQTNPASQAQPLQLDEAKDHFIQRNGVEFAGTHLLLDLWGASHLDDIERMEQAMRDIVTACGATLLHIHLHHFSPSGGVSGVAYWQNPISVYTPGRSVITPPLMYSCVAMPSLKMRCPF